MCYSQQGLALILETLVTKVRHGSIHPETARQNLVALYATVQSWAARVDSMQPRDATTPVADAALTALTHMTEALTTLDAWLSERVDELAEAALDMAAQAQLLLEELHRQAKAQVEELLDEAA